MGNPAAIVTELDAIRAQRSRLDIIAQRSDLSDEQDRQWQALDERETALTAELHDWIYVTAGVSAERFQGALA